MSYLQNMRVIEIPPFRAVSSGAQTLEELFGAESQFSAWVDSHRALLKTHLFEPRISCGMKTKTSTHPFGRWRSTTA